MGNLLISGSQGKDKRTRIVLLRYINPCIFIVNPTGILRGNNIAERAQRSFSYIELNDFLWFN